MGIVWLERSSAESGQGVLVSTKLTINPSWTMCPCSRESPQLAELYEAGCRQQVERGDPSPISNRFGALCPVLGFPVQDRHGCIEAQRVMRMIKELEHLCVWGEAERAKLMDKRRKQWVSSEAPSDMTTETDLQGVSSGPQRNPTVSLRVAQVAQIGYGVSILGGIQSTAGNSPGPPAVADPALAGGLK